jgi:multiple sugar transport system permease protein
VVHIDKLQEDKMAKIKEKSFPFFLLSPSVVIILFIVAFPLGFSLYLSFTSYSLLDPASMRFIGFNNYLTLAKDPVFWRSLKNTVIFLTIGINSEFLLGLGIALLLARELKGGRILRTLSMVPMMFAPVLVGFQFKWFFNDQVGLVNNLLYTLNFIERPVLWLIRGDLAMFSILAAEIWRGTSFMIIIFTAGLMSLPREPFEAAEVDGASGVQKFIHITFPLLSPFVFIAMAIRSLDIATAFDIVRIMTGGGPAHRTELIWTYVYRLGIGSGEFGMGCAMSYVTVLLSIGFAYYLFKQLLKARKAK